MSLALKSIIFKKNPFYVQFALSNSCNLTCKMCRAIESRRNEGELGIDEIEELARILSRIKVVFLVLTGGEPLSRKDLAEIVNIFTKNKIAVRLQTNGIGITKEKIDALMKAGLKNVTVSLGSLIPEKQDLITGKEGSYYEIMKGISLFSQHLPKTGSFCGINILVTKRNLAEIVSLVRFTSEIGFYASLIPVHLTEDLSEYIVRGSDKSFAFDEDDYEEIDRVYAELIDLKRKGFRIYNSYRFLKESPDFLKHQRIHWNCHSPYLYFAISPSGNFLPCVDIKMNEPMLGNGDFVKRYYSNEFREKVRRVVEDCEGCMYACWPEISYLSDVFSVFLQRIVEGAHIQRSSRRPIDYREILTLADKFRGYKKAKSG